MRGERDGGEPSDPSKRRLAQREHAALSGHDREREEKDGERDPLADDTNPELVEPDRHREERDRHDEWSERGAPPGRSWRCRSLMFERSGAEIDLEVLAP